MFERFTAEARRAVALVPFFAAADDRREMTPADLAAALAARPVGNTAGIWDPAAPPLPVPGKRPAGAPRFDRAARAVIERSLRVALAGSSAHIGTEHLLAALVRGGPPGVVDWLAARGATASAVDALLTRLAGGAGVEGPPAEPRTSAGGAASVLTHTRLTSDARDVVREGAELAAVAGRAVVTPIDLATALALHDGGNVARVWTAPPVAPGPPAPPVEDPAALAGPAEGVIAAAEALAREAGAAQVGTEHLLAALIRHGHPEVVTLLGERGGTAAAADALLAELAGGSGAEALPDLPAGPLSQLRPAPRRSPNRQRAVVALILLVLFAMSLVVCVWGP